MEHTYEQRLLHYRRDFHRHPETAWLEYRTSAILANRLEELLSLIHILLPLVGSMITAPGFNFPFASASSIMALAIRSLALPAGLKYSSFAANMA